MYIHTFKKKTNKFILYPSSFAACFFKLTRRLLSGHLVEHVTLGSQGYEFEPHIGYTDYLRIENL